jgi:transcriptional regulator of met regulon
MKSANPQPLDRRAFRRVRERRARTVTLALTLPLLLLCASIGRAQVGDTGVPTGLIKLFGSGVNFTAHADVRTLNYNKAELMRMPMEIAVVGDKLRVDTDMNQIRGSNIPQSAISLLVKLGMDRVTGVIRLDKKMHYIVFPNSRAYVSSPLSKEEAEVSDKQVVLKKERMGAETIDGHACVLNRVTVAGAHGIIMQALTWNANDLNDFPVQIETGEGGRISMMRFEDIRFRKPDAAQFEPPSGFKQFKDPDALRKANAKKAGVKLE